MRSSKPPTALVRKEGKRRTRAAGHVPRTIRHLLQAWDRRHNLARACSKCGCTDRYGCANGCVWVTVHRCSNCAKPTGDQLADLSLRRQMRDFAEGA